MKSTLTQDEAQDILERIIDLASVLGWKAIIAQTKDGDIAGLMVGTENWINNKAGKDILKPSH